jgi:tetratricopeptide (TPR) repeat protein
MLAHHYTEALELIRATGGEDSALREPARKALTAAGERAIALHAPALAVGYLQGALDLTADHDPDRARLLFTYLKTKWALGETELELTQRVHDLALASGQRELAAEALALLGQQHWLLGESDRANQRLTEASALVADAPPSRTRAHVRVTMGVRLYMSGSTEEGLELCREGLAEAEALGDEEVTADALRGIGTARASSGDEGGLADLERSAELGEKLSDPLMIHRALNNLANMHWHFGRIEEGARYLRHDRETQERFGLNPESATMRWVQGEEVFLLELSGAWKLALRDGREFLAALGDDRHYLVASVLMASSSALAAQGDLSRADECSRRALELAREIEDPQSLHSALVFRAKVLVLAGKRREAEVLADEYLAAAPQLNEWFFKDLPWVMLDLGREADFLEQAKAAPPTAWLEAGTAVSNRDFLAAAALYDRIGAKGLEAIARLHAAEDAAAAGCRAEADAELAKAQPFFKAQDAKPFLRRCEVLLAAAS